MSDTSSELWAELSSMATTVGDLTTRLDAVADAYAAAHRDDLVSEIREVERAFNAAVRRLNRLADTRTV
jgi:hypothetical protein